jgi:hypothetical protein
MITIDNEGENQTRFPHSGRMKLQERQDRNCSCMLSTIYYILKKKEELWVW